MTNSHEREGGVKRLRSSANKATKQHSTEQPRITVFFLPMFRRNPYCRLLARSLGECGVDVTPAKAQGLLPVRRLVKLHGKPDLLHLHWTQKLLYGETGLSSLIKTLFFLFDILLAKASGVKLVWTVHNLVNHETRSPRLEQFANIVLARLFDQLLVHCRYARDEVARQYRLPHCMLSKIHVVRHAHYPQTSRDSVDKSVARTELHIENEPFVFLYFGQVKRYKGVPHLIQSFQRVADQNVRLVIAGEPYDAEIESEIKQLAKPDRRINLELREIPPAQIAFYMAAADVVVLPFKHILTSGSLLLAMSHGKAVIAPAVGCVPEDLSESDGFLYDPEDPDALQHAMQRVLNAPVETMGKNAQKSAGRQDWAAMARQTAAVYQKCIYRKTGCAEQ